MNWLMENWTVLVVALACLGIAGIWIRKYIKLPKEQQIETVKKWLLWAVCEAEKQLGGGTGRLKLAMVYDMFLKQFPILAEVLPFAAFSALVDTALKEMCELLQSNEAVARVVCGK